MQSLGHGASLGAGSPMSLCSGTRPQLCTVPAKKLNKKLQALPRPPARLLHARRRRPPAPVQPPAAAPQRRGCPPARLLPRRCWRTRTSSAGSTGCTTGTWRAGGSPLVAPPLPAHWLLPPARPCPAPALSLALLAMPALPPHPPCIHSLNRIYRQHHSMFEEEARKPGGRREWGAVDATPAGWACRCRAWPAAAGLR